ncbi:hypothetical protein SELMODRAFT_123911 [Selaginella moellendorffii]|uniref:AAA+ ATPase domain-containing protein n=1 Tax=Selaginella moellendorffii TaxID=88036 RepID=D8SSL8_SELML|nr:hypothetical protein SELMODRAFT_123911 [Selaginella moellendorffii]
MALVDRRQCAAAGDGEVYLRLKALEDEIRYRDTRLECMETEMRFARRQILFASEELAMLRSVPLMLGLLMEVIDGDHAIVLWNNTPRYVRIQSTVNRELLKPGSSVALHTHSFALMDVLSLEVNSSVTLLTDSLRPDVTYADIGGLEVQKQEIREVVELPLTHPELYAQLGVDPPKGVLLYGAPGTGKTMLVKAVAHHTSAAFIRVVASEFIQRYLGEGPRMMRDVFKLAKANAPAIIFIDEVDAIATARFDSQNGADREVQRILMELLTQLDGFDQSLNVKVIMATNRADTLDPALLRPGRLDRKIEFPYPDKREKRLIFQVCTSKMNLSDEVDFEDFISRPDKITAAEISAVCQEAGIQAVRKNRYIVLAKDIEKGYKANVKKSSKEMSFYQ